MARRRRGLEQTIYFPWERGGGWLRGRGLARARNIVAALIVLAALLALGARERHLAGIRATRATLLVVHSAVQAYRADHEMGCPGSLDVLGAEGYLAIRAVDAWEQPIRLTCPGRSDPGGYDLMSDGPDGEVGGLDRIQ